MSAGQPIPNAAANLLIGLPNEDDGLFINGTPGANNDPLALDQVASGLEDMLDQE